MRQFYRYRKSLIFLIVLEWVGFLSCSNPAGENYSHQKVATPRFEPSEGNYEGPISLSIACETPDASIRFSTDGSEPDPVTGNQYVAPIPIHRNTILKAIANKDGWIDSEIATGTFIIPFNNIDGNLGAGCDSSYAITREGSLWAWGSNYEGRLGDGTTTDRKNPIQIISLGNEASQVSGGEYHTVLVTKNGNVFSWGRNSYGQLGDGTTIKKYNPVRIVGLDQVSMVSGGQYHSLALKHDKTVWAWGLNSSGQLGDGGTVNSLVPLQLAGLSNVVAVASGVAAVHSFAIKGDGTLWAWGGNSSGQLGDGTTVRRTTPVQVWNLSNVKQVAAGAYSSVALTESGIVWTWGWNSSGQLGNGTTSAQYTPIQVLGVSNVVSIGAGATFVAVLKSDGSVWTWGNNYFGQLGDGTTTNRPSPVQVLGIKDVVAISVGEMHVLALRSDGTIWAWGSNTGGALGDGTGMHSPIPVQVR